MEFPSGLVLEAEGAWDPFRLDAILLNVLIEKTVIIWK
jgi:hypothetical protein